MQSCRKCGIDVNKLTFVPELNQKVCLQCAQGVVSFPFEDSELNTDINDKRGK